MRVTKEQAAIIGAYTGILLCDFHHMHEYAEKVMGRPVFTHEFGNKEVMEELRVKSKDDFLAIAYKD